jgi:myosin heavy subunit
LQHNNIGSDASFQVFSIDVFLSALDGLLISSEEQDLMFSMMNGILMLGQLDFSAADDEFQQGLSEIQTENLRKCADFLEIQAEDLWNFIVNKIITVGTENIISKRNSRDCCYLRDSFASELYFILFRWVVDRINNLLSPPSVGEGDSLLLLNNNSLSISLVDIFGFESLKENAFEQLLINYANEKLHYYFLSVIILREQELYKEEGIPLADFSFQRLEDVLETIEGPRGIIDIMHDQITLNQTDNYILNQIRQLTSNYNLQNNKKVLKGISIDRFRPQFGISHYAGEVKYNIDGVMERNQDSSAGLLANLAHLSAHQILQDVYANNTKSTTSHHLPSTSKNSVACNFRDELNSMVQTIEKSEIHFIKCIKPNSMKAPLLFSAVEVSEQLACNGILEATEVSRSKYAAYLSYSEFFALFGWLIPLEDRNKPVEIIILRLFSNYEMNSHGSHQQPLHAIGKSKIFFSATAYGFLQRRLFTIIHSATRIQTRFRCFRERKQFLSTKSLVLRSRMIIVCLFKRTEFNKRVQSRINFKIWQLNAREKIITFFRKIQLDLRVQRRRDEKAKILVAREIIIYFSRRVQFNRRVQRKIDNSLHLLKSKRILFRYLRRICFTRKVEDRLRIKWNRQRLNAKETILCFFARMKMRKRIKLRVMEHHLRTSYRRLYWIRWKRLSEHNVRFKPTVVESIRSESTVQANTIHVARPVAIRKVEEENIYETIIIAVIMLLLLIWW